MDKNSFIALSGMERGGSSSISRMPPLSVTAAQSQGPGGVGSVGYVEVAGHEGIRE